ncbi:MAG: hypothetical protein ABI432_17520 [Flavobacteriales bacterium]
METIVNALVLFVATLMLVGVTLWILWREPKAPKGRRWWTLVGTHALFCLVLVLLLNGLPGFFDGNAELYERMNLFGDRKDNTTQRPFVLIDNSGNKQLVPDPDGNLEDSTMLVVTDRARLARLLQRLAAHQELIAQVVVDIAFTAPSLQDSLLREAVLDLAVHKKVLLARAAEENTPLLRFGEDAMADVTERTQEDRIAWHRSAREEGPSLPYALHLRLHERAAKPFTLGLWTENGKGCWQLVYPGFMPTWTYLPGGVGSDDDVAPDDLPMPIGHALDAGWPRLLRRLQASQPTGSPIVFIGEFPEVPGEGSIDRHRTFVGEQTGSAMLIDLFHEIENDAHVVKGSTLLGLYAALCISTWFVFSRAWPKGREQPPSTFGGIVRKHVWTGIKDVLIGLVLLGTAWTLRWCTGQQMNLAPVFIYFVALMSLVEGLRRLRVPVEEMGTTTTLPRPSH